MRGVEGLTGVNERESIKREVGRVFVGGLGQDLDLRDLDLWDKRYTFGLYKN